MGTRTESHLVEIQKSAFCPVILLEQGDAAVSRPHSGRQSHQPVSSSPCVRNAPLLDPGTPVGAPTIGRRLAGQTAQGREPAAAGVATAPSGGRQALRPRDDSFRARPIFSATTHLLSLLSGEIFQQQGA